MHQLIDERSNRVLRVIMTGLFVSMVSIRWIIFQDYNKDVDDVLRTIQIQYLFYNQNWRDLALPMIAQPEPYISHWSRIVDFLYVLPALIFSRFMGSEDSLKLAYNTTPVALLVCFVTLYLCLTMRLVGKDVRHIAVAAIAPLLLMAPAIGEFASGRIDHHNVQIVLMLSLALLLSNWTWRSGFWASLAILLSLSIGLETLPIIAVGLIFIVLIYVFDPAGGKVVLAGVSIGFLVQTPIVALVILGPNQIFVSQVDSFSLNSIIALMGFALVSIISIKFIKPVRSIILRIVSFVIPGLLLIVALVFVDPLILNGPYAAVDATSRLVWIARISQEKSVLDYLQTGQMELVALLFLYLVIITISAKSIVKAVSARKYGVVAIYCLALASLVFTLLICRNIRFSAALVPLYLPVVTSEIHNLNWKLRQQRSLALFDLSAIVGITLLVVTVMSVYPKSTRQLDIYDFIWMNDSCEGDLKHQLVKIAPARIMAPPNVGLRIIEKNVPGIAVAAIAYQRSAKGIQRMMEAFTSNTDSERAKALENFDYVAVCDVIDGPQDRDLARAQAPLFAGLIFDRRWDGLSEMPSDGLSNLRLYKLTRDSDPTSPE